MRTLAIILSCAAALSADEITLRNGGRVTGIVEEKGDRVVVRMEGGAVSFRRDEVERIDRTKPSARQEYEQLAAAADLTKLKDVEDLLAWALPRRLADSVRELRDRQVRLRWEAVDSKDEIAVGAFATWAAANGFPDPARNAARRIFEARFTRADRKDPHALYELGVWARDAGLAADALVLFHEAIKLNPEHEFSRRALGYTLYQGKWLTDPEVKQAMGLIEYEGQWMTPASKEAILTSRTLEKERKLLEEEREKLRDERTLAQEDFRRRMAALDSRAAEVERQIEEARNRPTIIVTAPPPCPPPAPPPPCCPRPGCGIKYQHKH